MKPLPTLIALLPIITALPAADLDITGHWIVTHDEDAVVSQDGQCQEDYLPGDFTIDIGPALITTSEPTYPGLPPTVEALPYVVKTRQADRETIQVTLLDGTRLTSDFVRTGTGVTMSSYDGMAYTLAPWDHMAAAAYAAMVAAAEQPADPLRQQPLAGTIDHQPWSADGARRFVMQEGVDDHHIRIAMSGPNQRKPMLTFDLPTTVGVYPLSQHYQIAVWVPSGHTGALTNGTVTVTRVTATAIDFGLTARGRYGMVVNGTITADISPVVERKAPTPAATP